MRPDARWPYARFVDAVLLLVAMLGVTTITARTLGTGLADALRSEAEFTLEVRHHGPPQRADEPTIRVQRLLADGQALRLDAIPGSVDWLRYNESGVGVPDELRFPPGAESRQLTFTARTFAVVTSSWDWAGSITVRRNGEPVRTMDYSLVRGTVARDDSPLGSMALPILLGLLLAVAVSWRYRPWAGRALDARWLATVLGTVHLVFWITQGIGSNDDSVGYLASADQLFRGFPSYFPPGYPGFLGGIALVAGSSTGEVAALIQHGMAVVAALWIFGLLSRLVDRQSALVGALLSGALPTMLAMPQAILTEGPTLFAMVGAVYFAVRARESGRGREAVIAGVLAGWAVLLRVVPLVPLAPAMAIVFLLPWASRRTRLLMLSSVTAGVMVLAHVTWFAIHEGRPTLVTSVGHHLYNRVIAAQNLIDTTASASGQLIASLDGRNPGHDSWWEVKREGGLAGLGGTRGEEAMLRRVAWEGLRSNLVEYAAFVPQLAWMELTASQVGWVPAWGESAEQIDRRLESQRLVPVTAEALRWRLDAEDLQGRLWPRIVGVAIAGFLLGLLHRRRPLVLALAAMPAGYLLCSAALDHFAARHVIPVTPFLLALGALALGTVPVAIRALRPAAARRTLQVVRSGVVTILHRAAALTPRG